MKIGGTRPEEAKVFDSHAGYHSFHAEETQEPYGSFEVFLDDGDSGPWSDEPRNFDGEGNAVAPGWYWAAGFPGCMWDDEPSGPFATSRDAREDADEWAPEFDPSEDE